MVISKSAYQELVESLGVNNVTLVAVSKVQPISAIQQLYNYGQRDFGENYVQELVEKQAQLSNDIKWHFIGHLQTNKVKYIAPFVYLIHGVDSYKLLKEIDKQAKKINKVLNVLIQVHIAQEESKFGMDEAELEFALSQKVVEKLNNVIICGLMGMATYSNNLEQIKKEFSYLHMLFEKHKLQNNSFTTLSMGMSGDYQIAIKEGSTMVRIGSLIFGTRMSN